MMGVQRMKPKKIIPYEHYLVEIARKLRRNSTYSERLLWKFLSRKQLKGYDFDRQKPIDKYIVDFFCNELMLAIEVDGDSHNEKQEDDQKRQYRLEELGVRFLRFDGNEIIKNIEGVLYVIIDWIEQHEEPTPNTSQEGN